MAGSHESNPNTQIATSSKKSKTGKSGHHKSGKSGQQHEHSGKKSKNRVHFSEEHSSKRQRVEDDPSMYKDGPLEAVSSKFKKTKPYFTNGMFIDMKKVEELGFGHLKEHLQNYMCWLGINSEYNVNVLRVFYQSLTAKPKYKKVNEKETIGRVDFKATVRGRKIKFSWRDINRLLGVTDEGMNQWIYPDKLSQEELEEVYETKGKKVSAMPDSKRVLQYVYSRLMTNKGGNFNEFTQLDNLWLPRFLTMQPINPGQLISMKLHRWWEAKEKGKPGYLPYPQVIAFLLEKFMIKSTEEADNVKCLPIGSMNLGKMGIKYDKPAKLTRSGSQAGCASHTTLLQNNPFTLILAFTCA